MSPALKGRFSTTEAPGKTQGILNCTEMKVLVGQSCLTLCGDPLDCSPPGSSLHGILQAGILEWTIPFSRGLPNPGIKRGSPALQVNSLLSDPPGTSHTEIHGVFFFSLVCLLLTISSKREELIGHCICSFLNIPWLRKYLLKE